ncbi:MAG TPA: glycosyltransferase [Deltaproteobacteria bacterium]|nr:glycosyltransferase [Deltaproteobacteria bacterium]
MKVLVVTTSYPDYEGSNRGMFIKRLCLELTKQGLEVAVLTPRIYRKSPYLEDDSGIKVHRFWFPSREIPLNQAAAIPLFPMLIYMISGFFKAVCLIIKEKPDIIHGNWIVPTGLIAALAGFLMQIPVINTARGMDMRVSEKGPIIYLFDIAVRLSDKVTVVSGAMKNRALLKDAEVFSSGVDERFFEITPDYDSKTVLYTRSLEPIYDAETLIRSIPLVIEKVPDTRFIIAGTGSMESNIKELAHTLEIEDQVDFVGLVPCEQIVALMKKASVYVSTATADGTSIALLEAMAAGLIPVATDIDANRQLISHTKDGFLFEPGSPENLADNIIYAFSNTIAASVLSEKREHIKDRIYWSNVAKRFITLYNHLLA